MRFLRYALCLACLPLAGLRAADEEEKQAPEEIPNFNQLDEYVYVPKSTLSLGGRFLLRGPKLSYGGQGSVASTVNPGDDSTVTVANVSRTYIDGTISPDARTVTAPTGLGGSISVPIVSDGRTNTWSYNNSTTSLVTNFGVPTTQLLPNGDLAFHTYSSDITDTATHTKSGEANAGVELILDRDMGKVGKHMKWSFTAGFSIADIHSSIYASVPTTIHTITDTYDLFGQVPPPAPFSSPFTGTQTVYNSQGQPVSGSGSTTQSQSVNQEILLGNVPLSRTKTDLATTTTNRYFTEGAYYTLRVGPTLIMPIGSHFTFNVSAGPAVIYAGSVLSVLEDLNIATGENFTTLDAKQNSKLLPAYYVDVDLLYQLTETAGFYMGGVYQGAGSYRQTVSSGPGTSYSSKVDFGSQEGFKGGMTVRF